MNEALVLLILVWAVLIVPGAVRSRNASPHATVGGFERAMDVLRSDARTPSSRTTSGGRQVFVPGDAGRIVERPTTTSSRPPQPLRHRTEDPVVARRRVWFLRTLAATGITFLAALLLGGGWLWLPFFLSAGLTGGYVAVLRRLKLQRDEARRVVRDLDLHRETGSHEDEVPMGVAAGGGDVRAGASTPDHGGTGSAPAPDGAGDLWATSGTVRLRRWDD